MKVTISVGGKFTAFHLARELEQRDHLYRIFTSYPYFSVKKEGVSGKKISCFPEQELLQRIIYKLPYIKEWPGLKSSLHNIYDWRVSTLIEPCDIFVGWSGNVLLTIQKIRKYFPAKIILECGSTHVEYQRDILKEERERSGIKLPLPDPFIVEKELKEYQEADYITLPSVFAKNTFLNKRFGGNKLIHVPLGVDTQNFRPAPKQDNKFRVIFVGICARKGVHYLLQAIKELKIRDLELCLIGRISDEVRPVLKKYSGHFKYLGGIAHRELYKYYSQGSVFVIPSLEDGFSLSMLEAMACGLPVICSTNTGAKDVVRQDLDGFIIPVRNIESLKEKIIYLYNHPQVSKDMGRQARMRIESNFTWSHYGKRIIEIYEKITLG